jgi:hypothetical protein
MATFPNVKSGTARAVPLRSGLSIKRARPTDVLRYIDGSEQRWKTGPALSSFALVFSAINGYDLSNIRAFWLSCQGAKDTTWSLTLEGTTYQNCAFDDDRFQPTDGTKPGTFSLTLNIVQTLP